VVSRYLYDILALNYFSKVVLKNVQGFVGENGVYKVISWSRHYMKNKKERGLDMK